MDEEEILIAVRNAAERIGEFAIGDSILKDKPRKELEPLVALLNQLPRDTKLCFSDEYTPTPVRPERQAPRIREGFSPFEFLCFAWALKHTTCDIQLKIKVALDDASIQRLPQEQPKLYSLLLEFLELRKHYGYLLRDGIFFKTNPFSVFLGGLAYEEGKPNSRLSCRHSRDHLGYINLPTPYYELRSEDTLRDKKILAMKIKHFAYEGEVDNLIGLLHCNPHLQSLALEGTRMNFLNLYPLISALRTNNALQAIHIDAPNFFNRGSDNAETMINNELLAAQFFSELSKSALSLISFRDVSINDPNNIWLTQFITTGPAANIGPRISFSDSPEGGHSIRPPELTDTVNFRNLKTALSQSLDNYQRDLAHSIEQYESCKQAITRKETNFSRKSQKKLSDLKSTASPAYEIRPKINKTKLAYKKELYDENMTDARALQARANSLKTAIKETKNLEALQLLMLNQGIIANGWANPYSIEEQRLGQRTFFPRGCHKTSLHNEPLPVGNESESEESDTDTDSSHVNAHEERRVFYKNLINGLVSNIHEAVFSHKLEISLAGLGLARVAAVAGLFRAAPRHEQNAVPEPRPRSPVI